MALTKVTSGTITDSAVTAAKIADDAIVADKIADDAIVAARLADDAIVAAKIADNAVTADKIASNAVTDAKLAADVKTNIVDSGTGGLRLPTGTTGQRTANTGNIRFNSTIGAAEYYDGTNWKSIDIAPVISSLNISEVDSQAGGNQTVVITGSNFYSGATVTFLGQSANFNASTTTIDSSTQITAVAPKASFLNAQEPYSVKVTSAGNIANTLSDVINVDSAPAFTTAAGSIGTAYEDVNANLSVSASDADGDTIAYSETTSNVLGGAGLSLNSSTGAITGNPNDVTNNTTLNFTLRATAGSKTADRNFSLIVANPPLDGTSSVRANTSAAAIKTLTNTTTSGLYWITINGTPRQIYCDMSGFNSTGYMLMATMKDMTSGFTGSTTAATATTNINNYTNWNYDSNWWTSSTGEAAIVAADYNFSNNRDYKSYLWSQYQVNNSSKNAIYLVNGNSLGTTAKRVRAGGSFSSSTLVNVFNGTTSVASDNDNNNNTGDAWHFSSANNSYPSFDAPIGTNRNINVTRDNWTRCYMRIGAKTSSDAVLYGSTVSCGAGIKYVHMAGQNRGAFPSSTYTQNSNYTQGISMTLWVK